MWDILVARPSLPLSVILFSLHASKHERSVAYGERSAMAIADDISDDKVFIRLDALALVEYLGITLLSHKQFNCSIEEKLASFYRSANAILRIEGRSSELVMLQLLESHSLSILTFGIEVIHVADADTRRKLRG